MTTITLTGTYGSGYALEAPVTTLSITASGYVGGQGVFSPAAATHAYQVINDGRVEAAAYLEQNGIVLTKGGSVINGRGGGATAVVSGFDGVHISGGRGKVVNLGRIEGVYGHGVVLDSGGSVTNGSNSDTSASIEAYDLGVVLAGKSGTLDTLANFGTISTRSDFAQQLATVEMKVGGIITNGSNTDRSALITGLYAIRSQFPAVTVANFGTIIGTANRGSGAAVYLGGGGSLTNGSNADLRAQILGGAAARVGALTATNFGRIVAYGQQVGLDVGDGGTITNGSSIATHALIQGFEGVSAGGLAAATITNFGTIWGRNGVSLQLANNAANRLVVEAGSAFVGYVRGGGSVLELANGVGLITSARGTLSATGSLTISGSMAKSQFGGFAVLQIDSSGTFATDALVSVGAGLTIQSAGTLSLASGGAAIATAALIEATGAGAVTFGGSVVNTGALIADGGSIGVTGAVGGSGTATIIGAGTLDFGGAASQAVTFSGPGGLFELGDSQAFAGTVAGFSGIGKTSFDLDDIAFEGPSEATFSGTATSGVLTVSDGTHVAQIALLGDYRSTSFVAADDGHGGVLVTGQHKGLAAMVQGFVQAAAGVAASASPSIHHTQGEAFNPMALASPRLAMN